MIRSILLVTTALSAVAATAGQEEVTEAQMVAAVLPLPADLRDAAGVFRRDGTGRTELLRESRNGLSCSVDDPSDDRFDVRCYHDDFWEVIRRVRELRREVASPEELAERIRVEMEAGELVFPAAPTAGYRMLGPSSAYDAASATAGAEIAKWQSIHFPFRTAAEMGLTEARESSEATLPGLMPFVMASGTWWSHVMIVHEPYE